MRAHIKEGNGLTHSFCESRTLLCARQDASGFLSSHCEADTLIWLHSVSAKESTCIYDVEELQTLYLSR